VGWGDGIRVAADVNVAVRWDAFALLVFGSPAMIL
jgi:hypothetical protein